MRMYQWDKVSPINGIEAEVILAGDRQKQLQDCLLVEDDFGKVTEIQYKTTMMENLNADARNNDDFECNFTRESTMEELITKYMEYKQVVAAREAKANAEAKRLADLDEQAKKATIDVPGRMTSLEEGQAGQTMLLMSLVPDAGAEAPRAISGEHSLMFNSVRLYYNRKYWAKENVAMAVRKGLITAEEYREIVGEDYPAA